MLLQFTFYSGLFCFLVGKIIKYKSIFHVHIFTNLESICDKDNVESASHYCEINKDRMAKTLTISD